MKLFSIALAFAWYHRLSTIFIVTSIALATALVLLILHVRHDVELDLRRQLDAPFVVGSEENQAILPIAAMFQSHAPLAPIRFDQMEAISKLPGVKTVFPFRIGRTVQGIPLIETTPAFLTQPLENDEPRFPLSAGTVFSSSKEAVLGADVASETGFALGDALSADEADRESVTVVGILEATRSPKDDAIFTLLPGGPATEVHFVLVQADPRDAARVQNELAATEGLAVVRLEDTFATIASRLLTPLERVLAVHGVTLIALSGGTILAVLSVATIARRREYAILRALGAWPREVFAIVIVEAVLQMTLGAILGVVLSRAILWTVIGRPPQEWAAYFNGDWPELVALACVYLVGILAAWWPAWRSYRSDIATNLRPNIA